MHFGSARRLLLVVATSLLAALAVAWFGLRTESAPRDPALQAQQPGAETRKAAPSVNVLSARVTLPTGHAIRADDIYSLTLPEGQIAKDLLRDTPENRETLERRSAPRDIPAGTPFVVSDLLSPTPDVVPAPPPAPPAPPSMGLADGMRAIAIPVTAETAVAGLISGGDRVDVILSYDTRDGERAVRTILRNVRVIARDLVTDNATAARGVPRTITLELNPEGAKVLTLAMQTGDLLLILSPPGEAPVATIAEDEPMLSSRIFGPSSKTAPTARPPSVEIFRGNGAQRAPAPAPHAPPSAASSP